MPTTHENRRPLIKATLVCSGAFRNGVFLPFYFHLITPQPFFTPFQSKARWLGTALSCRGAKGEGDDGGRQQGGRRRGRIRHSYLLRTFLPSLHSNLFFPDPLQFSIITEKNHTWRHFTIITRGSVQNRWVNLESKVDWRTGYFSCTETFFVPVTLKFQRNPGLDSSLFYALWEWTVLSSTFYQSDWLSPTPQVSQVWNR